MFTRQYSINNDQSRQLYRKKIGDDENSIGIERSRTTTVQAKAHTSRDVYEKLKDKR